MPRSSIAGSVGRSLLSDACILNPFFQFSFNNFGILELILRSLIHLELIFLETERNVISLFCRSISNYPCLVKNDYFISHVKFFNIFKNIKVIMAVYLQASTTIVSHCAAGLLCASSKHSHHPPYTVSKDISSDDNKEFACSLVYFSCPDSFAFPNGFSHFFLLL